MKKKTLFAVAGMLWFLLGITAAAAEKEDSVTAEIRSGGVSIRLHQYRDEKRRQNWKDPGKILPGQKIPIITEVENRGEDCYIRYQVTARADSGQKIPQTAFQGVPDQSVTKENRIYLTEILKHGERTELFSFFTLPENWNQEEKDQIHIQIVADAIQSRNVTVDFQSEKPWGDTVIQKVSKEGEDQQLRVAGPREGGCQVILEGDRIILVPDSFFQDIGSLVPGDTIRGEIQIDNQCRHSENVYWKLDTKEETLLRKMRIQIKKEDGTVLYDGSFQEYEKGQYKLLGTYPEGAKERLLFTLHLEKDADNAYRLLHSGMTWTFRAVSAEKEDAFTDQKVRTGEDHHLALFGMFTISAGLMLFLAGRKRRRHE